MGHEVNPPLFYILSIFIITAAILVVRVRNIFYAALALGVCFFGVAAIYLTLDAEFLAGMQILIYVGAVVVVILFAIMLTSGLQRKDAPSFNRLELLAFVSTSSAALIIGLLIAKSQWIARIVKAEPQSIQSIGDTLIRNYMLPFELISVLLLAALIGAIVIARKEEQPPDDTRVNEKKEESA